jgi:hypothetical protein
MGTFVFLVEKAFDISHFPAREAILVLFYLVFIYINAVLSKGSQMK